MKSIFTTCIITVMILTAQLSLAQWQQTNGPHGGYVSCSAHNADEIYVGTQYGGVFRSTNQGNHWEARNNGLQDYNINCLVLDGDDLYVGTRLGGTGGVCHSNDDGLTWSTFPSLWTSYESSCIAASGDSIYVGTAGGGNFFSHDGGLTWASSLSGITPYQYYASTQLMTFEDKVFTIINGKLYESTDGALTYTLVETGFAEGTYCSQIASLGSTLFVTTSTGFYTSNNSGSSWQNASALLPDVFTGMTMSTADNSIYISIGASGSIFHSTNGGFSWQPINVDWGTGTSSFYALSNGKLLIQSGYYSVDWSVTEAPQLHYTGDNGTTWTDVTNEITSTWCMSLTSHNNDLFVGTMGTGLYSSSDDGDSWTLSATPNYWDSFSAVGSLDNTLLASGTGGIIRSIDGGTTWTLANEGLPSTGTFAFAKVGTDIFATTPVGIVLSTDDGQTWSLSNNGINETYIMDIMAIDNVLYAVSQTSVYKSVNYGNSWNTINNDLPSNFSPYSLSHIGDVLIVAGGNSGSIYKSENDGVNWTSMNFDTYGYPSSFAVHNNAILVSTYSSLLAPGVFMTNDLGETWTDVSLGLDNNQVFEIIIHNEWAFACTKGSGVYKRQLSEFIPASISETTSANISLYPNPSSEKITIKIPSNLIGTDAVVTNELGQQVKRIGNLTSTNFQMDCTTLASGFYVLKIGNEQVKFVVR